MRSRSLITLVLTAAITLGLTGCPSTSKTQRTQIAQAANEASIVLKNVQQAEITAYHNGLIPAADHIFIQNQFVTISALGQTTDSCILSTTDTAGAVKCINTAVGTLDQINTNGGLYLKSDEAKKDFSLAILSARTVLTAVTAVLGGVQ